MAIIKYLEDLLVNVAWYSSFFGIASDGTRGGPEGRIFIIMLC